MVLMQRAVNENGPVYLQELVNMYIDLGGHCALSLSGCLIPCLIDQEQNQELEMRHLYQHAAADLWTTLPRDPNGRYLG